MTSMSDCSEPNSPSPQKDLSPGFLHLQSGPKSESKQPFAFVQRSQALEKKKQANKQASKLSLNVVVCGPNAARGMTRALHFHSEVHRAFSRGAREPPSGSLGRVPLPHRLHLGQRPPVPGGPALARAGSPLPQLAGCARQPRVSRRAQ